MAEWLERQWRFVRYLLFPSRVLLGFMVLITAVSVALGVVGYLTLYSRALWVAGIFILLVFRVSLYQLPQQLNQLLRSRAWVLYPGGIRQPVSVAIGLLLVWSLVLAAFVEGVGGFSFWPAVFLCWGLASAVVVLGAWAKMSFVFVMLALALIAGQLPEQFDWSAELERLVFFGALSGAIVGVAAWWWLVRQARLGCLSSSRSGLGWGHGVGVNLVVVKGTAARQFAQAAVLSSHPFRRSLGASLLVLFFVVILAVGNRYLEGEPLGPWLLSETSVDTLGLFLLIMAGVMAFIGIQSLYRRLPSLWLLIGGDRRAFYRYLVYTQWGLFTAAFVPVFLYAAGCVWQLELPLWRWALVVLAWGAMTVLALHWSNYTIGNDNPWLSVIGLLGMIPALLVAVAAGLVMPLLAAGVSLVALLVVGLVVRRFVCQRWQGIDLGALRSVRSL